MSDASFLFADLAGFTALTESHGDERAAEVAVEFCERVSACAENLSGHAVKSIGDAVMIRSESVTGAVNIALRIMDEERFVMGFPAVRVGIHRGTAVSRGGDWFGHTVNLAARVTSLAAGGQVLATAAVVDSLTEMPEVQVAALGFRNMRNLSEPVAIFEISRADARSDLVIDPVCRMRVDPATAAATLNDLDRRYFCSVECLHTYLADPEMHGGSV